MTIHPDPLELVGTRLAGRYLVIEVVDETTLSIVYRATHVLWRRNVAIKVFKAASSVAADDRAELVASFVREGALLAELSETCSAICQARDVGSLTTTAGEWMPYMVLEWLEGDSLNRVLERDRERGAQRRTMPETVRLLTPIAGGARLRARARRRSLRREAWKYRSPGRRARR